MFGNKGKMSIEDLWRLATQPQPGYSTPPIVPLPVPHGPPASAPPPGLMQPIPGMLPHGMGPGNLPAGADPRMMQPMPGRLTPEQAARLRHLLGL